MKRKILSLFMILCMILSINVTTAPAAFAVGPPTPTSNSYFLITKSSPSDSSTETNYYYVYAGTSETALSPFHGTNADSESSTAYSTVDKAITDINSVAASSATLYLASTGNALENVNGTLDTGSNRIILTSGIYTIKGAVKTTENMGGIGLFDLQGASVIIDGATIDSADIGIRNVGSGNVTVNSGTITSGKDAICFSDTTGDITVNGGTITAVHRAIYIIDRATSNVTINGGTISSTGGGDEKLNFVGISFVPLYSASPGKLTITGGKISSKSSVAVAVENASVTVSGDEWNDTTHTGTLLTNATSDCTASCIVILPDASGEIKGGTISATGSSAAVEIVGSGKISGGLIKSVSSTMPTVIAIQTTTIAGGRITGANANTSVDISDVNNFKVPGTIFVANVIPNAKLYISGGTITNTAATGYAIANGCMSPGMSPGQNSYLYLSGTPTITGNIGVYSYNNIYANDGNSTYYTGAPVSISYSSAITPGATVAVSNVSAATNASLFSLKNEGYSLQLSGTDLIIGQSSSSSLSSILSQNITAGSEAGTITNPKTAYISVVNSVTQLSSSDITPTDGATVAFYGTDSTFTTAETGSVALTAGGKTTVYIKVTAQDGQTVNHYAVAITRAASSSSSSGGSSGGGSSTANSSATGTVSVVVNGKTENAGTETNSIENGKSTVTVAVNNNTIESKIKEAVKSNTTGQQNVIQVTVADIKSDVVKVELTGDIVKQLETNTFDVSVKRDAVEYVIPAKELTISNVAKELGVAETSLKDIKVEVQITKLDDAVVTKYNEVAKENGATIVFPPTAFEVVAKTTTAEGKTEDVKISKFSNYVERVMEIPVGVDPSKITTGIVFNPDGTYSHVPTDVYQKDGKWYAKLNSLTNSNYSVVWNPVTVKSVENHWSKDAVNDMASRLVIFNADTFEPNKAITRADFAEYIVRALGLYREGEHQNKFADVYAKEDRTLAILIASEYGIVTGYSDGTFRGDNQITRQEAMTMYQRAMEITKLTGSDVNRISKYSDSTQVSKWAVPYVTDVLSAHVFNGTTATTISPKSNLTYAESAQAIKNLLVESKLINK